MMETGAVSDLFVYMYIYIMVFRLRWRQAFKRARHVRSLILTRRSRGGRKITFAPYLIAPLSPSDKHMMVSVSGMYKNVHLRL